MIIVTLIWNFPFHTARMIAVNRSDIVVQGREENIYSLRDISVCNDKNISQMEFDNLHEYKDQEIKIQNMSRAGIPLSVIALLIHKSYRI